MRVREQGRESLHIGRGGAADGGDDVTGMDAGLGAGPSAVTETTPTPAGAPFAPVTVVASTPSAARPELVTCPVAISCLAMLVTMSEEITKPSNGPGIPPVRELSRRF